MHEDSPCVFVVDDDRSIRESLSNLLRSTGLNVQTFASAHEFLTSPRPETPSCLVLDVRLPGLSGLDLQQELAKGKAHLPIIFITGHGDIPMTVRAMKAGARDFLTKPFRDEDLLNAVNQAIHCDRQMELYKATLAAEPPYAEDDGRSNINFSEIVGQGEALRRVLKEVETVAPTDATVLLQGETGTGKELLARALHRLSPRHAHNFVTLNCAAIPPDLLESELFGHEKGAFTGALTQRLGRFELAHKGTLFLDEIGDLPLALQPKLLRVLQEHTFERLGSSRTLHINVRLVAATHRDLAAMVQQGTFRSDLYYRVHVLPLIVPPLRERRDDIPVLARHFAQHYAHQLHQPLASIPAEAMAELVHYDWPGNVRELQNVIERAVILSANGTPVAPGPGTAPGGGQRRTRCAAVRDAGRHDARAYSGRPARHPLGGGRPSRRRCTLGHETEHPGLQDGEARHRALAGGAWSVSASLGPALRGCAISRSVGAGAPTSPPIVAS